jgi:hypothetical protein
MPISNYIHHRIHFYRASKCCIYYHSLLYYLDTIRARLHSIGASRMVYRSMHLHFQKPSIQIHIWSEPILRLFPLSRHRRERSCVFRDQSCRENFVGSIIMPGRDDCCLGCRDKYCFCRVEWAMWGNMMCYWAGWSESSAGITISLAISDHRSSKPML